MQHGFFIWSAYGATALVLLWTALSPLIRQQRALRRIERLRQERDTGGVRK